MAVPADKVFQDTTAAMEAAAERYVPRAPLPAMPHRKPHSGLLDWFAPSWALRAEREISALPRSVCSLLLLVFSLVFLIGFIGAVGGGYWSIQGVRLMLSWLGVAVVLAGIPSAPWWIIPIANTLIQITARRIPATRRILWVPSLWFDGATTGAFLAFRLLPGVQRLTPGFSAILATGLLAAILGMLIAIIVEHIVFGALVLIRACWRR